MIPLNIHKPEDLFELDSKALAGITDKEYEEFFAPCLDVTRPELAAAKESVNSSRGTKSSVSRGPSEHEKKMALARSIAAQFNLKI